MYERIMVPLDGSNAAEIALPYAEEITARLGIELILVSVSEPTVEERDHLYRSYLDHITEDVKKRLETRKDSKGFKIRNELLLGKAAHEILRYTDESKVNLIIMASRGRSGRGPWLLGNIASKVLRAVGKPVLLIRAPADEMAGEQGRLIKRILLPLDGSKEGEAAVPCTEALAKALSAELVLLQVVQPIMLVAEGSTLSSEAFYKKDEERRKASAMEYLNRLGKELENKGVVSSSVVVSGTPAIQIIEYAEAKAIDVVAMSTHGRSGISRWVFGGVTDKVLHAGNTPVLTVRASGAQFKR